MKSAKEWCETIRDEWNWKSLEPWIKAIQRDALEVAEIEILNALFHELSTAEIIDSDDRVKRIATPEGKRAILAVKEIIRDLMAERE